MVVRVGGGKDECSLEAICLQESSGRLQVVMLLSKMFVESEEGQGVQAGTLSWIDVSTRPDCEK